MTEHAQMMRATHGRELLAELAQAGAWLHESDGVQREPWRGHVTAPEVTWLHCGAVTSPPVSTPFGEIEPSYCGRPATVRSWFAHAFLDEIAGHDCGDDRCFIGGLARGDLIELAATAMPVCGLHVTFMNHDAVRLCGLVGIHPFRKEIMAVEFGHADGSAELIDLREGGKGIEA